MSLSPSLELDGSRRAAVTGLGAITAHGSNVDAFWAGLLAGRSGFARVTLFDTSSLESHEAAEVGEVPGDPLGEIQDRGMLLALAAASEAITSSGASLAGERAAVLVGTTLGGSQLFREPRPGRAGAFRTGISVPPDATPDPGLAAGMGAMARILARRLGARGPVSTLSSACTSGTAALGAAARHIWSGEADRVLVGGFDDLSDFVFSGFDALHALSGTAVRPFDRRRDGLGLGEGAGFLVLEELEAVLRRGASPLALIRSYASASDAYHRTRPAPGGEGLARAVTGALSGAGRAPADLGLVSTHGTATVLNDRMEANALRLALGPALDRIPVNSIKSGIGHTLGGAGTLEAILCVLALRHRLLPPTPGFSEPDPACPLDVVAGAPRPLPSSARLALSTSSGFGGVNAALVLEAI